MRKGRNVRTDKHLKAVWKLRNIQRLCVLRCKNLWNFFFVLLARSRVRLLFYVFLLFCFPWRYVIREFHKSLKRYWRCKSLWNVFFVLLARSRVRLLSYVFLLFCFPLCYVIREFHKFLHRGWAQRFVWKSLKRYWRAKRPFSMQILLKGHFGKCHNSLCLSPLKFCISIVFFYLGTVLSPKRNCKQCLCKIWGDKQRVLWYFPKWPISFNCKNGQH